jgi:hypothetical protein
MPAGLAQRTAEQKLDLCVQTPQIRTGPPLERVVDRRIEPERKCLSIGH